MPILRLILVLTLLVASAAGGVLPTFREVQTSSAGTAKVWLADEQCDRVTVYNQTGTTIRLYRGTIYIDLADQTGVTWPVQRNANEITLKRADESTSQVTVKYLTERDQE